MNFKNGLNFTSVLHVAFILESLRDYLHDAKQLSNDPGKVDSNFFCYAATVLSPHRKLLIFTQRMHKPT